MVAPGEKGGDRAAGASSAAASFPDCWLAYGATNPELQAYGADPPLAAGEYRLLVGAQLALLGALAAVALSAAPQVVYWFALALLCAVLCSAVLTLLRLLAAPSRLWLRRDDLRLQLGFGRRLALAWDSIAEIGLVRSPGRLAVGLRLRPNARPRGGPAGWLGAAYRRLTSGFDLLLVPANGDCELLGRVLLRYCIDPKARRRLPTGDE